MLVYRRIPFSLYFWRALQLKWFLPMVFHIICGKKRYKKGLLVMVVPMTLGNRYLPVIGDGGAPSGNLTKACWLWNKFITKFCTKNDAFPWLEQVIGFFSKLYIIYLIISRFGTDIHAVFKTAFPAGLLFLNLFSSIQCRGYHVTTRNKQSNPIHPLKI